MDEKIGPKPQPVAKKGKLTQGFKPGNPYRWALGNPGRLKGSQDRANKLSVAYGEMLEQMVEGGDVSNADAIALRMIHIALTGKPGAAVIAAKELADRSEGKPVQSIQVSQVLDEGTAKRLVEIGDMLQRFLPKPVPALEAEIIEPGESK